MTIRECVSTWDIEDRANLAKYLDLRSPPTPLALEEAMWTAYNNRARALVKSGAKNAVGFVRSRIARSTHEAASSRDTWHEPSCDELVAEACKMVKVYEKGASTVDLEAFLVQKLFVQSLNKMGPRERKNFLESSVELQSLAHGAGVTNPSLKGQATTLVALSAAQASGFGVYLLATTTLGSLTAALGITLPFAVYTGLTSLISIAIGPVGWSALGFHIFWKLTGPNWKKLLPSLLYIISVKTRPSGGQVLEA